MKKMVKSGRGLSHDLLFDIWDPNISGTAEVTNLKFCMLIEGQGY